MNSKPTMRLPAYICPDEPDFEKWWEENDYDSKLNNIHGVIFNRIKALVKRGYVAGRAAMQAEPVSTTYKLPPGWKLLPVEPTEKMIIEGFESEPDEFFSDEDEWKKYQGMSGCEQAAHRAKLCWSAMLAAAPAAPEGWIKCSDRMPIDIDDVRAYKSVEVLVTDGVFVAVMDCNAGVPLEDRSKFWCQFSQYGDIRPSAITHWMPLPAAPEQEV